MLRCTSCSGTPPWGWGSCSRTWRTAARSAACRSSDRSAEAGRAEDGLRGGLRRHAGTTGPLRLGERIRGHGEDEALPVSDAGVDHGVELVVSLDAFGDDARV